MTNRRTKEVAFFCLPEELLTLLQPILARRQAQLCVGRERGGRLYLRKALFPEDLKAVDPQFYAADLAMTGAYSVDSLANLTQVWCPVFSDRRLRMGRVALLVSAAEASEELRKLQEQIYGDIRKALMKKFRRGILGRNSRTGGEHFYNDIFVSDQAARAYEDGIVLATLMGDGFVTYHLVEEQSRGD